MKYCNHFPYHIVCISCLYPPIIEKRYRLEELPAKIINTVCAYQRISEYAVKSPSRKGDISKARQMCMALIKEFIPKKPLNDIGKMFKRDHSTVITAIKRVNDFMDTEPNYKQEYNFLRERIQVFTVRQSI